MPSVRMAEARRYPMAQDRRPHRIGVEAQMLTDGNERAQPCPVRAPEPAAHLRRGGLFLVGQQPLHDRPRHDRPRLQRADASSVSPPATGAPGSRAVWSANWQGRRISSEKKPSLARGCRPGSGNGSRTRCATIRPAPLIQSTGYTRRAPRSRAHLTDSAGTLLDHQAGLSAAVAASPRTA